VNEDTYRSAPTVRDPGSLYKTISFGSVIDGTLARKDRCLEIAKENIEQAQVIISSGPHPTTAVLQLELALLHIGNAVALIFDRDIEGKSDEFGLHNAAARAIVAYADEEIPALRDVARFAASYVRGRNDYSYRHQRLSAQDMRRLYKACTQLYDGLRPFIRSESHVRLQP
jgi:hypothetical protein